MKYCLLGEKLAHSYSARIHTDMGLDYRLNEVAPDKLADFFSDGYDGFNVTIPYKKAVIPFLKELSEEARRIGAVNTVVKGSDGYYGYNTDVGGMEFAFKRKGVTLRGKKVMILGSGGTSNTAAYMCEKNGASFFKVSRTGEINYRNCYALDDVNVIINATPVGTFPDIYASPLDLTPFKNLEFVFDCVYNPFNTRLILQAKKLGVKCSDGLPMLVKQALLAEEIWGVRQKAGDDERIMDDLYREKANVVLCGMPSCGKTTVGKALSKLSGKDFVDTDEEILKETGKTPAEIITEFGEEKFRDTETEIVYKVAKRNSSVLALGGGAVLRERNVDALRANGVVFFIKRDLTALTDDGRPLSKGKTPRELYDERKKFYKGAADFTVSSDCGINGCAREIADIMKRVKLNPSEERI